MLKKTTFVLLMLIGVFTLLGGCAGEQPAAEKGPVQEEPEEELEEDSAEEPAEEESQPAWRRKDFYVMTAYDNSPYGCEYGTDRGRQMDMEQMLAELDELQGYIFFTDQPGVTIIGDIDVEEGHYLEFHFFKEEPQSIDIFYIAGDAVEQKHYLRDYPFRVPDEPGVYNFFAELTWNSGEKETVFFRATVEERNRDAGGAG